jgi:hypothetical protein
MITILKDLGTRRSKSGKMLRWCLCKCDCGIIFEARTSNVKSGQIKSCGHDRAEILEAGREIRKEYNISGTNVIRITGNDLNKNNTTGYRGVSPTKNGKYKAYIHFRRKQYYLGTYNDLEIAYKAYLTAKSKIYGDFLKWYAKEYPTQWQRINH